jgi:hypothetical protein
LIRYLGDNRRKQMWTAVLVLESGARSVLRTKLQQLGNGRAIWIDVVNLSLGVPSGLCEELTHRYALGACVHD